MVASRPLGLGEPPQGFRKLLLQPLDAEQRRSFLEKWLRYRATHDPEAEADRAARHFDSEKSLRELSHNPLHLTLLTVLWEKGVRAPSRMGQLYDEIFDLLLSGRHKDPPVEIAAAGDVHEALRRLAYGLTVDDLPAEDPRRLEQRLREPELEALRRRLETVWGKKLRAFLDEVAERTYVLGPHDGPHAGWRFWHRTFREALTAERLAEIYRAEGEDALFGRIEAIAGDLGRWAEPFALLAGRLEGADRLVRRLFETDRSLGLRSLASVQGLRPETLKEILGLTEDWEERRQVFESIPEQIGDPEACLALVDRLRAATRDGNDLFFLHRAAQEVGERWSAYGGRVRELLGRFFDHVPALDDGELFRSVEAEIDGRVELWPEIPDGGGWIGSPEGVGYDEERPRHRIAVAQAFRLSAVPVTNHLYAAFDPGKPPWEWEGVPKAQLPDHPRVSVTWYEAVSFCRWLATLPGFAGARLPTEAEWEYACRAGSETAYWSGDSEEDLAEVGWYGEDVETGTTHPVGGKPANPWGLYDVHGNVWEWTASVWAEEKYKKRPKVRPLGVDPSVEPADLAAPSPGGLRVMRGGGSWDSADWSRSAYRNHWLPDIEHGNLGFRVLLPSAPRR